VSRQSNSPTADEQSQLKRFVKRVDDMLRSRFIQRARERGFLSTGPVHYSVKGYDLEEFRAFFGWFRQVALLPQDHVYLERIIEVLERRSADDETRKGLTRLRASLLPKISGACINGRFSHEQKGVSLSCYEMLEALAYGDMFHTKEKHLKSAEFLRESEPGQWLWWVLLQIIVPTLRGCLWLVGIIRREGFLDDADIPAGLKD
jgi:hypothetical protein